MKAQQKPMSERKQSLRRTHPITFVLNDEEFKALNRMIKLYKIKNKSKWIRETVMFSTLQKLDENSPRLF